MTSPLNLGSVSFYRDTDSNLYLHIVTTSHVDHRVCVFFVLLQEALFEIFWTVLYHLNMRAKSKGGDCKSQTS